MMRIIATLALISLAFGANAAERLDGLDILAPVYPRAFFFRQAERPSANHAIAYEDWEQTFSRLGGIIGKCLDEEVPGRSSRNIDFFTRFKEAHPDQAVLLHFNGNARDPRFETDPYFAGHWLYHNGCRVTEDVALDDTVIHIESPELFRTDIGRYRDKNDDLAICRLDDRGKPDWSRAEQMELVGVDRQAKTLTVRRGRFATEPMAFRAGASYAAAHVMEGPWGPASNMLWAYNYAVTCPRDAEGRTCSDRLVADFARWMGEGGPLERFDGVEFDVLFFHPIARGVLRGPDANADGKRDDGYVDGVNVFGLGVNAHLERMREALGPDRLLLADGHDPENQRSVPALNGIESEGWPHLRDPRIGDWSGGINRHLYWTRNAFPPRFSYINHKFVEAGDMIEVPLHVTRLVLAAACLTDSAFTYSLQPEGLRQPAVGVWDELVAGVRGKPGWLGRPLDDATPIGYRRDKLLALIDGPEDFLPSKGLEIASEDRGRVRLSPGKDAASIQAELRPLTVPGRDLLIQADLQSAPPLETPGLPRLVWLTARRAGQLVSPEAVETAALRQPNGSEAPAAEQRGRYLRYWPSIAMGDASREAIFAHPPYGEEPAPAFTVWKADARVPEEAPRLAFSTGLRPSPGKTDGVRFVVELASGGEREFLFDTHQERFGWRDHSLALAAHAGKAVTLRFLTGPGPQDDPTSDHAFWGDVFLLGHGETRPPETRSPSRVMAWADGERVTAQFYFRDIGPGRVELALEAEGGADLAFGALAFDASAAAYRVFENGIVLANPSSHPVPFDLAVHGLGRYQRIQGTPGQDPQTNNGARVGAQVVLPPMDALFLEAAAPGG